MHLPNLKLEPLVPPRLILAYEDLKENILKRLRIRHDFLKEVDEALVDQLARLYTHWLYLEALLSGEACVKDRFMLTQAFKTIDLMINEKLEQLAMTPALRRRMAEDLKEDDEVAKRLRKLVEGSG